MHTHLSPFWKLAMGAVVTALLPACTVDSGPDSETDAEMLFGLTEAEVTSLLPLASKPYDLETWLEIHRRPFDCANYGSLCEHIGPEAAYELNEGAYRLGLEGATRSEINAFVAAANAVAIDEYEAVRDLARDDEHASDEAFDQGGTSNERVKTKIWADVTGVGDGSVQVECTYQRKSFGVWGGTQSAFLEGLLTGHFHELNLSGAQYEDTGDWTTGVIYDHRILSTQLFLQQQQSGDDIHGWGTCEASKGNFSASATADASED